jgi:hypothetical protein
MQKVPGVTPGGKARLGREADQSSLSSYKVKNEYELYIHLLSPCIQNGGSGTNLYVYILLYEVFYVN